MPSPPRSALVALLFALLATAAGGCCGAPAEPAPEEPSGAPEEATVDPEGDQYPSD